MEKQQNFKLYFDGGCFPNPGGRATYGFVLYLNDNKIDEGHGIVKLGPDTSNNLAEHGAVYQGMQSFLKHYNKNISCNLNIIGDSQLIIHHLNNKWRLRPNKLYYHEAVRSVKLVNKIRKLGVNVQCIWIPREQNTLADELSNVDRI